MRYMRDAYARTDIFGGFWGKVFFFGELLRDDVSPIRPLARPLGAR